MATSRRDTTTLSVNARAGAGRRSLFGRLPGGGLACVLCVLCVLSLARPISAGTEEFPEYQLKAAFLYNFAKFVTWPPKSFSNSEDPMTIGILGDDPFGPLLKQTLNNKTVNGRPFEIKHFGRNDDVIDCHILFISRSEKDRILSIVAALKGRSVLTVSEVDRFAHDGGMINFLVVQASMRFEINLHVAERAGLQVSSKLWGLGTVIKSDSSNESK